MLVRKLIRCLNFVDGAFIACGLESTLQLHDCTDLSSKSEILIEKTDITSVAVSKSNSLIAVVSMTNK